MPTQSPEELHDFHRYLSDKLSRGAMDLSPEEALDEWRQQHPSVPASAEELGAIQEALDDMANGDAGVPFEEFDREFRRRHQLPAQP